MGCTKRSENETMASASRGIDINIAQKSEVTPSDPIELPTAWGPFELDENVVAAFPDVGAKPIRAVKFGKSLWGTTAKIIVELPDGKRRNYFIKVVSNGETGRLMCMGEYESLKAIHATVPGFCPEPYAYGAYSSDPATHFLLVEFRYIGSQPAEPQQLAAGLAELHKQSRSPTGKFGFHMRTCHSQIDQAVGFWDDSWCAVFSSHLGHVINHAKPVLQWPEFNVVADLTLSRVVPRLLLPLQAEGRILKPSLVHGDCWDGNTATDKKTGKAFVFDVCSFFAHNEYDTGNWRAPRHRLSDPAYIQCYKKSIPPSEPVEDWDARNVLYSLPYNVGNAVYVPGSTQRQIVYEDMKILCKMFCPDELERGLRELERGVVANSGGYSGPVDSDDGDDDDEEEEEEEEEED
ncbi:hypothetical protein MAPG_05633 [Magnaporthiopsis poae ATCC 64411]|uniref:protein-ribulosamine 3-kinase n=1 Tax=Magnaporthiopsis poae (strain ATCC 64411 / 73-15) TaxID=644358 RepID=A0A0C4DZX2_MAGP6|nr:hypothetical protein MAPG_05633 [Magnaporthiopsis poae ATCC 64411]